ncbi:MAG: phosphoribosylformylglycinamidine cyclo-ligase, partial [Deltaproteobacteria bacterium]|nr:phosphoribosylformylglycinamidine cyclo-ligase [Deltaproteobacteria bacterium]
NLRWDEMLQIFNCGIGYVLVVAPDVAEEMLTRLHAQGEKAWAIGRIDRRIDGEEQVRMRNI